MMKTSIDLIKSKLKDLYVNYTYKKILKSCVRSDFDLETENESLEKDKNLLLKNGALGISNYLADEKYFEFYSKINKQILLEASNNFPIYSFPIILDKDSIFEKILLDQNIAYLIKSYLGSDAILDYASLSSTINNSKKKIISEKWHYDNVGKRIKLFFYINSNSSISTDYIRGTNNIFHNSYSITGSRVPEYKIDKFKGNMLKFFSQKGSLVLFDTNGYHRGNFNENLDVSSVNKDNNRLMIKMEFSSKAKSEKFFGKSNIIGPRYTFFSKKFNFEGCNLIERAFLTKIGEMYFYDKSYSSYR